MFLKLHRHRRCKIRWEENGVGAQGLESRLVASNRVGAQTSVQVLYQDIYGSASPNGGWNWHISLSYAFGGSEH